MWNRIKEKLKSPVVWGEFILEVSVILTVIFGDNISTTFKAVATPLVAIAVAFGILNVSPDCH